MERITTETTKKWMKSLEARTVKSGVPPSRGPKDEKCSIRANKFRQNGNQIYASSNSVNAFGIAHASYAQSIAHAPANSQELPLAYSNLSLILLKLEKYSECLQAIDSCMNSDYPEGSKFKIFLRKIECLKIVDEQMEATKAYKEALVWIDKNQSEEVKKVELKNKLEDCYNKQVDVKKRFTEEEVDQIWQDFSIKTFKKEIPAASSAIDLKYNERFGRHFVATRDIQPGEILMRERPFVLVCSKNSQYSCCWECFECMTNCIPCDCCSNVIFCSNKCKEKAWKEYHQFECKILSFYFYTLPMDDFTMANVCAAYRILIRAINDYGSFAKLKEALESEERDQSLSDPRTKGFTNGQLLSDSYRAVCSLISHEHEIHSLFIMASLMTYKIATNTTLLGKLFAPSWQGLSEDENFVFATRLITGHLLICTMNSIQAAHPAYPAYSGIGLSIAVSLINHSCFKNARYEVNNSCTEILTILPIKEGEQIFIDYLGNMDTESEERKKVLLSDYYFDCSCAACTKNWPFLKEYSKRKDSGIKLKVNSAIETMEPYYTIRSTIDIKYNKDNESLKSILKNLSALIEELVANVPKAVCTPEYESLVIALVTLFTKLRTKYM